MKIAKSISLKKHGQQKKLGRSSRKEDSEKFLGKTVLSIDIGQHTTKLVLGRVAKPGVIEVKRAISVPTPHDSMEKGRILDDVAISEQIAQVISREKLTASYVFCTMENAEIITREIILPTADEAEMKRMLEYEVQQYMPVDLGNYIIQSKGLDSFSDDGTSKTRFLATAVPKDLVQSYYDLMQRLNLKVSVMDIQSNAINKLVLSEIAAGVESVFPADESVAIVDLGYSHINVVLIENGKYQFNRYIDQGAAEIDRSLKSVFEYEAEDIERRKQDVLDLNTSFTVLTDSQQETDQLALREVNVVKNVVDNWSDELERVFKYYTSRSAGKSVQKILIHGGTAQIKGLSAYLTKVLGIPVERIETISCIRVQDSANPSLTCYLSAVGAFIRR